jgi:hypothetical protein
MGSSIRRVSPGESALSSILDASRHNAVNDAVAYVDHLKHQAGSGSKPLRFQPGIVLIRNESGSALARFDILGISGVVPLYADNSSAFKSGPALTGDTPDIADHAGKFVVLLAPCANNAFAQAMLAGQTVVRIDVTDEDHEYADVKDGDATELESDESGLARILWKESGTGTKWAMVRMGGGGASGDAHRWGKLDEDLEAGSSATVSLWQTTGGGWGGWDEDSTENETATAPLSWPAGSSLLSEDGIMVRIQRINGVWILVDPVAGKVYDVVTDFRVDETGKTLDVRTRSVTVLRAGTVSGWITKHTGTDCS